MGSCNKICRIDHIECNLCDTILDEYKEQVLNLITGLDNKGVIIVNITKQVIEILDRNMNSAKIIISDKYFKNDNKIN